MAFDARCSGVGVVVGEGGGGNKEWGFPSLTVRRDQTSLRVLCIVQRDRDPLPKNKGVPPIRAAVDQQRKTWTRFDQSELRSTQQVVMVQYQLL
jgi:hypothetical protein